MAFKSDIEIAQAVSYTHLDVYKRQGQGIAHGHLIGRARMEGDGAVQPVEGMTPGHERLAGEQLFCRATEVNDGALQALLLHFGLHTQNSAHMANTQQMCIRDRARPPQSKPTSVLQKYSFPISSLFVIMIA